MGQRIDPEVGVGTAVQGPVPELIDHAVQALGHDRDLRLGEVGDAQGLDQPLDSSGGNTGQVGLCDHGHQRPLRPPPWLQQPVREVAASAQLGNGQLDAARPSVPVPFAVAIARVAPLARTLTVLGAAELLSLGAHQLLHHRRQHLPKQVRLRLLQLLAQPADEVAIHTGVGHRLVLLRGVEVPEG